MIYVLCKLQKTIVKLCLIFKTCVIITHYSLMCVAPIVYDYYLKINCNILEVSFDCASTSLDDELSHDTFVVLRSKT